MPLQTPVGLLTMNLLNIIKQRQGEIPIDGGFALVSETATDTARLAREQSERDAAKAALEAKQIQMFPCP